MKGRIATYQWSPTLCMFLQGPTQRQRLKVWSKRGRGREEGGGLEEIEEGK